MTLGGGVGSLDYRAAVQDEICLEGLAGITLQALWLRLSTRPSWSLGVETSAKRFVWSIIQVLESRGIIRLVRLEDARPDLVIYDRYLHMDGDLGIVIEPEELPEDIYPFCLVDDVREGVKGSSWTYNSASPLDDEAVRLSLEEAEEMGGVLVVVGSQEARTLALLGEDYDPLHVAGITATQWAILERVGRARYQGEVTQGKLSLQFMNENPKTLFYHRKSLLSKGLLMKQVHHQKTKGQNFQGTLFHLPRFYVERKPKALILVRNAIEFLKTKESGIATYEEVRNYLNLGNSVKKLFKTHEFQKFMKGDVRVVYRTLFPEAEEFEWKRKGTNQEKTVRVVKLLNKEVKPDAVFGPDNDEDDDDLNMTERESLERGATPLGVLDQSSWLLDRTMMWQAYHVLEEAGAEGLSQQQLGQSLGQGKLEARTICRNLLRRQLVVTVMKDIGRQRVTNFVAIKWQHVSRGAVQYRAEKDKNNQLTGSPTKSLKVEESDDEDIDPNTTQSSLEDSEPSLSDSELPKEELNSHENSPDIQCPSRTLDDPSTSPDRNLSVRKDMLRMPVGLSPLKVAKCDMERPIEISISSGFSLPESSGSLKVLNKKQKRSDRKTENRGETYRQLKRSNTIIEAVRHHKVIDDPTKLYKIIQENELKEGYNAKMDKKSLMRLLSKLGKEGQVKNIRVVFKHEEKTKVLHFVCEPEIDESNTVIQSAIEQAKMKFNIQPRSTVMANSLLSESGKEEAGDFLTDSVSESVAAIQELESGQSGKQSPTKTGNQRFGRRYGLQPKFVKMRELHLLLFYLIHGFTGEQGLDQEQARDKLRGLGLIDGKVAEEMEGMEMFSSEVSWKMFVPPLPSHQGWGEGWCLMCDILLRLPLSIFVKLINITFDVSGLQDYLTHPVRRNYLIRSLPHGIRNKLLFQRKYIFSVHEVATRLAYIGVLQFGPQKLKEKDQVFLFLNRHTSLMDTTSSGPGYHQVDPDKIYPQEEYSLTSLLDVEQYWHRMWEICIFTPLGGSSAVSGQEITLEVMEKKAAMIESLSPRSSEEAVANDDGSIPGDGLGAAGMDSSIFAHLKRNWTWNTSGSYRKGDKLTNPPFIMSEIASSKEVTVKTGEGRVKVNVTRQANVKRTTKGQKRKRLISESNRKDSVGGGDDSDCGTLKIKVSSRPSVFTRVVGRKRVVAERKPYYDEKDKAALRLMRKLRVDWSAGEDSFLLLCKVAGSYLCTNSRHQMVQYTAVRDLLHEHFPESQNKTSRACQRRLNYMLKNQTTADNVALFLEDVKQDQELVDKFRIPSGGQMKKSENEARLERDFRPLVEMLMAKYKENSASPAHQLVLPPSLAEVEAEYSLVFPTSTTGKRMSFTEPTTVSEVQAGVVNALITSSLCSASDKKSWAYQLFKIYQQYPDSLLREVMATLRDNKMVSLKKHYNKAKVKEGNYLPLSSAPYQLSVTFSHTFLCRYQYDIYSQAWQLARVMLEAITDPEEEKEFKEIVINQEGGFAATVVGLMARRKLQFRTTVPEQLVVLDPNMAAVDENYVRILQRYKELLKNAGSMEAGDLEVMKGGTNKLTSTTLFTKAGSEQPGDKEATSPEVSRMEGVQRSGNSAGGDKEGTESSVIFQEGDGDNRSNTTVAKSASRIALYMMREEMKESPLESNPVQHSHDFFVISSCGVFGRLVSDESTEESELVSFNGLIVDKKELPGDYEACKKIMTRYSLDVNGKSTRGSRFLSERTTYVPLSQVDFEEVRNSCLEDGWTDNDIICLEALCDFVTEFKILGATKKDIRDFSFPVVKHLRCEELLECALQHHLLVKVGVVQQRFVAYRHCRDWLLHSFKLIRTNEKLGSVKFAGKLYQGNGPLSRTGSLEKTQEAEGGETETVLGGGQGVSGASEVEGGSVAGEGQGDSAVGEVDGSSVASGIEGSSVASSVRRRSEERKKRRSVIDDAVGGEDIQCSALWKNPKVGVKMSREVAEACEKINWGSVDEVLVAIRPWVRVDGTLNRRVLDRLLGAVLGLVMQWPGQTVTLLLARFSPALQPAHTRELVDLLSEMGCVVLQRMVCRGKPSLFSRPTRVELEQASVLDEDSEVVVEAEVDAITRLGMFIGDKVYNTDFACQCPCHPDRRM